MLITNSQEITSNSPRPCFIRRQPFVMRRAWVLSAGRTTGPLTLQWAIQIGRFDIQTAAMTLSRFRAMPRQGHLDRLKRIHGCLSKMCHATIKIRTDTLITLTSPASCVTGNAPAMLMPKKRFLWVLPNLKENRQL